MIIDILVFVLFPLLLLFIICYCKDYLDFWEEGKEHNPFMPALTDVNSDYEYIKNEYVKEVISPSYSYFVLSDDLVKRQSGPEKSIGLFFWFLFQVISAMFFLDKYVHIGEGKVYRIILFAISVAWCAASYFIVSFVYKKTPLKLNGFNYDIEHYLYLAYDKYDKYEIPIKTRQNNYIISVHHDFLIKHKETIIFRQSVSKIMAPIIFIFYALAFAFYTHS